ncbi:hypothetical protein SGRA_0811 [Saprospira grandis str. Lewin]|uniref:Uncharacterized protein n=1 Tax=Saprospira grandis (strain Lewin) TaxID=984262 RepID=H6L212_SAPGL|nr:hypothetical protein SGRA_0811 [Saprospira grandis str. Lewin]
MRDQFAKKIGQAVFGPALRSGGRRPDRVFERSEKTKGRANSELRSLGLTHFL